MAKHEDEIYQLKNVPTFEAIYGKGLISLGGYAAVDHMVGLDLHQKHVLDIGFGIGGMAHYLASKFDARVTGLEVQPWMVDYATQVTPDQVKGRVRFLTYDDQGHIPMPSSCVDMAYSKGVFTNIEDKRSLLKEIARVLRPAGQLCLIDWLAPPESGSTTDQLSMGQMSYKETAGTYRQILSDCGFEKIECLDVSQAYLIYVQDLMNTLSAPEHIEQYGHVIGDELRQEILDSHANLLHGIESGQQLSFRIRAVRRI